MEFLYDNPEPVPSASQLAVLPFAAAVEGFLRGDGNPDRLRITVHRTMSREGNGYLQQACAYLPSQDGDWRTKVGRLFPVTEGIMGAAFENRLVWRTKHYPDRETLLVDLQASMRQTGDTRRTDNVGLSYFAIPFVGPTNEVVLILYGECYTLNFFADDARLQRLTAMCYGLCGLFDWLQRDPFPNLRNFPLQAGQLIKGQRTVYPRIQEPVPSISPPRFEQVDSFNYEASAA
jgi:hypothetical protein